MFSSDDLSASVDNYSRPRPKKFHKGPWWSTHQPALAQPKAEPRKRSFKRNFDSGVFMGSETSSDVDYESLVKDGEHIYASSPSVEMISSEAQNKSSIQAKPVNKFSPEQQRALGSVQSCIDQGDEVIDLDRHALSSLPWPVLEPLQYFTREPPSSGTFTALEPELQLSLKNNELTTIPSKLYGLKHLNMLSIQNNSITELSPAIRRSTKLTHLNVAMNDLHFLPWELVELTDYYELASMRLLPNPLFEPVINSQDSFQDPFIKGLPGFKECKYYSRVAYLDIRGRPVDGVSPSTCDKAKPLRPCDASSRPSDQYFASKVPSLYEQALRICAGYTEDFSPYLSVDLPSHVMESLKAAQELDLPQCSVCSKRYVVPRTEWIEWWTGLPVYSHVGIPLLRRGCSWHCGPDALVPQFAADCGWKIGDWQFEEEAF